MVVLNPTNNLPNFDFKGTNSLDQKVYLTSVPSIPSPEMRIESVPVKGRDSTYTITDGTYEDIEIQVGLRTYRGELNYQTTMNRLNEWLRVGWANELNEVTFSMYPQWHFKVKYIQPHEWQYNPATGEMTTVLSFKCDPFKYSDTYREVVGVTTSATPFPPREFKFKDSNWYRGRIEHNYQALNDIKAVGFTKVLDDDYYKGKSKNELSETDGAVSYAHQLKYTSGSYRNFIDDFYSSTTSFSAEEPDKVTAEKFNSLNFRVSSTSLKNMTMKWVTVDNLLSGRDYYFDMQISSMPNSMLLRVEDANGVVKAANNRQGNLIFKAGSGKHTVYAVWNGIYDVSFNSPRLHQMTSGTQFAPARNSTFTSYIFAYDVRSMLDSIETGIITDAMTTAQIKTALNARNVRGIFHAFAGHQSSTEATLYQLDSAAANWVTINKTKVTGVTKLTDISTDSTTAFVNNLYVRKNGSRNEVWAIFMVESSNNFDDGYVLLDGKYFTMDKTSLSLGLDVQPQSTKEVFNDGTANAFPYLKIWKKAGVTTCTITFTGKDYAGRNITESIVVKNLNGVEAGNHIEVDCDLKEVVKYNEADPTKSVSWNIWSTANRFPTMRVGSNIIKVENADKVEIEWRTRRV